MEEKNAVSNLAGHSHYIKKSQGLLAADATPATVTPTLFTDLEESKKIGFYHLKLSN